MIRTLKVWWIKRKARAAYLRWCDSGSGLDCGAYMTLMLRGQTARSAAREFDTLMDQLRDLGEPVPDKRLSPQGGSHD